MNKKSSKKFLKIILDVFYMHFPCCIKETFLISHTHSLKGKTYEEITLEIFNECQQKTFVREKCLLLLCLSCNPPKKKRRNKKENESDAEELSDDKRIFSLTLLIAC